MSPLAFIHLTVSTVAALAALPPSVALAERFPTTGRITKVSMSLQSQSLHLVRTSPSENFWFNSGVTDSNQQLLFPSLTQHFTQSSVYLWKA